MAWRLLAALLVAGASQAAAFTPPLPPPRPADLAPAPPALPPPAQPSPQPTEATPNASPFAAEDAACESLLASGAAIAARVTPVSAEGGCGIAAPVSLKAIVLAEKRRIDVVPNAVMRCDLAAEIVHWIAEDVVPLVEKNDARIARLVGAKGYDCRSRNRQAGAKLSAHGTGEALDVTAIEFADGRSIRFADRRNDMDVAVGLRVSACMRFSTVLGPGADGFHEDHVHLDLVVRRNGGKICHRDVR